jgi:hypothetical protein
VMTFPDSASFVNHRVDDTGKLSGIRGFVRWSAGHHSGMQRDRE